MSVRSKRHTGFTVAGFALGAALTGTLSLVTADNDQAPVITQTPVHDSSNDLPPAPCLDALTMADEMATVIENERDVSGELVKIYRGHAHDCGKSLGLHPGR